MNLHRGTVLVLAGASRREDPTMDVRSGFRSSVSFFYSQPFIDEPDIEFSNFQVAMFEWTERLRGRAGSLDPCVHEPVRAR